MQQQQQYYSHKVHAPQQDPYRISTNNQMAMGSTRSYSPSQISDDSSSYHSPSSGLEYTGSTSAGYSSSYPSSPKLYDQRQYEPSISAHHRSYSRDNSGPYMPAFSLRNRASSPLLHRSVSMYEQETTGPIPSNARHQCPYCGKRFSRPSGLKIHLTTHTGDKRELCMQSAGVPFCLIHVFFFPAYVCPEQGCGRSFSVRSNMRRHVRIVHQVSPATQTSESGEDGEKTD
jgi:hypothetical protein